MADNSGSNDDLTAPFIFVRDGDPWPTEWLRDHPGAVRIPATFVPHPPDSVGQGARFGEPQRPFHEYPPGKRAPGESPETGDPSGMDYSDAARILREINEATLMIAAQAQAAGAAARPGTKSPHSAVPGQLDPRWVKTADDDLRNPAASAYDEIIKQEIDEYKRRFAGVPGVDSFDPRLFKAQLLTETGPANPQWVTRPAQIGNRGDQGYGVLRQGEEGSRLVMAPQLRSDIAAKSINDPILNVKAGIAYALTKAALTRVVSRVDPTDPSLHEHVVQKGQTPLGVARTEHTTLAELELNNAWIVKGINAGETLKFHRASMVQEIYAFRRIDAEFLSVWYDGRKDPEYAFKIAYLLNRLP